MDSSSSSSSSDESSEFDSEDDDNVSCYTPTDDSSDSESERLASSNPSKKARRVIDDGNVNDYQERLAEWKATCSDDEIPCHELEGGYRVPLKIWDSLYKYQKVGVQWMWNLHSQRCGGILADEMGLGKTVQTIAFLAGLSHSQIITQHSRYKGLGPVLLVTPPSLMYQWTKEFHKWWPPFRVSILHESGSHLGSQESLIQSTHEANGVLIISYQGVVSNSESLLALDWDYIILDEGHKIRDPDAEATLVLNQFETSHRLILSGSPIQNKLKDIWSLIDFVFPGKLGTRQDFEEEFSNPIKKGEKDNASQDEVALAYNCVRKLNRTIEPYLLRRMKADVKNQLSLPDKDEQVLFCRLTSEQRAMYLEYLDSVQMENIVSGKEETSVGHTVLREICNHPDLYYSEEKNEPSDTSDFERSGKMVVVESLLRIWKDQGHRCLLFAQSRKMLKKLEVFLKEHNYSYLRMDGETSTSSRQLIIDKFNQSEDIFVFLLPTRVGGLGVNLTGANRVIIYDPDFYHATDSQASLKSWCIGQKKDVTIYRLISSGTIEEKLYQRQISQLYLTTRVLSYPKQVRFFKSDVDHELFTYTEMYSECTETVAIFAGTSWDMAATNPYVTGDETLIQSQNFHDGERKPLANFTDGEWKRLWRKKREKRDVEWKKRLDQQNPKAESEAKVDNIGGKYTIKVTRYHPSEVDTAAYGSSLDSSSSFKQDNDYVLKCLFAKTGVVCALQHDSVINPGHPDFQLIEAEAERVAQKAIRELKSLRRTAANGVINWSESSAGVPPLSNHKPRYGGKFWNPVAASASNGHYTITAGQVEPSQSTAPSGPPSSRDLINGMLARNLLLDDDSTASDDDEEETSIHQYSPIPLEFATGVDYHCIMNKICKFVALGGVVRNQVSTRDLLNEFKGKLPEGGEPLFRALLKQLCNFTEDVNGLGLWQLKPEFL